MGIIGSIIWELRHRGPLGWVILWLLALVPVLIVVLTWASLF
jgi:hypothetical protein